MNFIKRFFSQRKTRNFLKNNKDYTVGYDGTDATLFVPVSEVPSLRDITGLGRQAEIRLNEAKIYTVLALAQSSLTSVVGISATRFNTFQNMAKVFYNMR